MEPTGEQKKIESKNYVDAEYAGEEKESQTMAWARSKNMAADRNSVEEFSSRAYASRRSRNGVE